jgi:transposase InsO family protein
MNQLYRAMDISKQGFHQHTERYLGMLEEQEQLLPVIAEIRRDHPQMSARVMYGMIKPTRLGRDRFEEFCFSHGLKIARKRAYHRTTDSRGVTRFDNLLAGFELTGVNRVWVSDITYYRIGERFYYLTFIMDLFSRRIVGHAVSENLMTECTTLPAIRMAIAGRRPGPGLIFHSDGGGQYYCKEFLKLTQACNMKNSMCTNVYENPNAERVNGTIKNSYLKFYAPENFSELRQMTEKAVNMYNNYKPHTALNCLSPDAFERQQERVFLGMKGSKVIEKKPDNPCPAPRQITSSPGDLSLVSCSPALLTSVSISETKVSDVSTK